VKTAGSPCSGRLIKLSPGINRVLRLIIPFVLSACLLGVIYSLYDYETFLEITGLLLVYFIPPAGKESLIPAAIAMGIPWLTICLSLIMVDLLCCLFMLWNFEVLGALPFIGPWINRIIRKGSEKISKHTWLEGLYVIGLMIFVFLPFQGTGSVSGTVLGKMAGIPQIEIFMAVGIGATLQSFLIGLSAYALNRYFGLNLWYLVAFILGIIILITLGSFLWYSLFNRDKTGNQN
jgi:uncharacterized membrane protein